MMLFCNNGRLRISRTYLYARWTVGTNSLILINAKTRPNRHIPRPCDVLERGHPGGGRRGSMGVLRRLTVVRRRVLIGSQPVLERRLIASPELWARHRIG